MTEEELFKTEERTTRAAIADTLREAADQIEAGDVQLASETAKQAVAVPENPRFEVELERVTDSETGQQHYELEYELGWTE